MLFRLPFSDPTGWSIRKGILVGLVVLHSVWIVVHLNLVSRDLINPWKLGGYGMYTTAHPNPGLHLFDSRVSSFGSEVADNSSAFEIGANHGPVTTSAPIPTQRTTRFRMSYLLASLRFG